MKIKTEKNQLLSLINRTQNLIEKRSTMPVLANALLKAQKGTLKVFATNLEVSLTDEIEVDVERPGSVAINSKNLFNIIRELPSGPVELERQKNNWLKVLQQKSRFNIAGINPKEYPGFPIFSIKEFMEIKPSVFLEMIEKTIFSVSDDETRYHLNGVYFERISSNEFKMVSTDGHRLSLVNRSVDSVSKKGGGVPMEGVIIPRRGLNEIKRLVESSEDNFQIAIEGSQLIVCQGKTTLMIRLIEGKFPNYQQLIPQDLSERILFDREKFLSSLRRVSILSNQKSKSVVLDLSKGLIKISSNDPELGDAKEEIEVDYQGKDLKISFNIKYILDVLSSIEEEEVSMEFKDKSSPGLLRPHGDKSHTCIIMPMRV